MSEEADVPPEAAAARDEIVRLKGNEDFVARYLEGGKSEKETIAELHARAYPDAIADEAGGESVDTSAQAQAMRVEITPPAPRGGVPDGDLAHLEAVFRPPAEASAYVLPPLSDAIGLEGVAELQRFAHSAALPVGVARAIAERAAVLSAPEHMELRERECDSFLEKHFGDQLDAGFAAVEKLTKQVGRSHPALLAAAHRDGWFEDSQIMLLLMRHALNVYGPRS